MKRNGFNKFILGGGLLPILLICCCFQTRNNKKGTSYQNPVQLKAVTANPKPGYDLRQLARIRDVPDFGDNAVIQCPNKNTYWIISSNNKWRTTDSGVSWSKLDFINPSNKPLIGEVYVGDQLGWVWYMDGYYKTEDGGRRWVKCPATPIDYPKGSLCSLEFRGDYKNGWIAGGIYRPLRREEGVAGPSYLYSLDRSLVLEPAIYSTRDGGKTWQRQKIPVDLGKIDSLYFKDMTHGLALMKRKMFFTQDGGKTWRGAKINPDCVKPSYIDDSYEGSPSSVYFLDSKQGWVVYDDGHIVKSIDGGANWCDLADVDKVKSKPGENLSFTEVYFSDVQHGLGLGIDGYLYKTVDGGKGWEKIQASIKFYSADLEKGLFLAKEGLFHFIG